VEQRAVEVNALDFWHGDSRGDHQTLKNVSVHINHGEVLVLTGPSGSGKSTLLTIVGGLRSAHTGTVEVLGTQLVGANEKRRVELRRRIGFIFQQHHLAPALTVAQNIQLGLQHSGAHRRRDARERIRTAAERVGLVDHLHKRPSTLSGGQQQRAGIARALVNEPKLVLADEPTASLDWQVAQAVLELFDELAATGSAIVLVTHDKRILERADRILMLEDGQLVPPSDRLMKEMGQSVRTLMQMDSKRLGRMLSFGHALAQVALADGRLDDSERDSMAQALAAREVFNGPEVELIVELALAQARAWAEAGVDAESRSKLVAALYEVAAADSVVTDAERVMIEELIGRQRR
jgi:putative ABC transport system ATP-binding protein